MSGGATREEEASVEMGGRRLSAASFALFSGEARAHLTAIREEHEALRNHNVVTDALIEAVRSLADVSRTVEAATLDAVCLALAEALEELSMRELSEDEQSLMDESIDILDAMVSGAFELRAPASAPELVSRLGRVRRGATGALERVLQGEASAADPSADAQSPSPEDTVAAEDSARYISEAVASGHEAGALAMGSEAPQDPAEIDLGTLKALLQQIAGDLAGLRARLRHFGDAEEAQTVRAQLQHLASESDQAVRFVDALEADLKRRGLAPVRVE